MSINTKQIIFDIKKRENIDISLCNLANTSLFNNNITFINKLYLKDEFNEKQQLSSEINKKINGYRSQDKKKNRNVDDFITFDETVEKIVTSKLKCYYCKCNVLLFYEDIRQNDQWTLERIDNKKCHSKDNVVISCLKCNLKRRCIDSDRFKYSKQFINIKKSEF